MNKNQRGIMMNELIDMTYDEKAKIGQAINLACTSLQGTKYNQEDIIKLVFNKYLPLITAVQKEYMIRRNKMQDLIKNGFEEEELDPLKELF